MYRTIEQCYQLLKQNDKDSAITKYWLRKQCKLGTVKTQDAGSKILVDYRSVQELLNIKD